MYQTKNLGLNITEIDKDSLQAFNFDIDLGDNFKAIDEKTLSHRNITNCLLEVPQDIKLELVDGVLTLKEGSKVYIPNGFETDGTTKKFDEVIVQNDLEFPSFASSDIKNNILAYAPSTNKLRYFTNVSSGDSALLTGDYLLWYDTVNNLIKESRDGGATWLSESISFPLCLFSTNTTTILSIDQVFNGFGYIGSTVFALPGVKGLVPNGRNADGSINNVKQTLENVFLYTFAASNFSGSYITSFIDNFGAGLTGLELKTIVQTFYQNKQPEVNNSWWFDTDENQWKYVEADLSVTKRWWLDFGLCNVTNGVITSLTPKKPFHAVDFNDYSTKIAELEAKIEALQAAVEALQG